VSLNAFDTHADRQNRRGVRFRSQPDCATVCMLLLRLLLLLLLIGMHQSFSFETV